MIRLRKGRRLAAIDVGTNAVRLAIAAASPAGLLRRVCEDRAPVRPGEGVFADRSIRPAAADRLLAVLGRFRRVCDEQGATVRAVATSAFRDADNADEVVGRVRREVGLRLEVISGREEARLVCLGALHDRPAAARSLVIDVGGGSTEIVLAKGHEPVALWSLPLGALRLTELTAACPTEAAAVASMRRRIDQELARGGLRGAPGAVRLALGSSGTIRAVIAFASGGGARVGLGQLEESIATLLRLGPEGRARHFEPRRADVVLAGAVILLALARALGLRAVEAASGGLREGVLVDLAALPRVRYAPGSDASSGEPCLLGRGIP